MKKRFLQKTLSKFAFAAMLLAGGAAFADAPVIETVADISLYTGHGRTFMTPGSDADGDALTWSVIDKTGTGVADGQILVDTQFWVDGDPAFIQVLNTCPAGTYAVTIQLEAGGETTTQDVNIVVADGTVANEVTAPANGAIIESGIEFTIEGQLFAYDQPTVAATVYMEEVDVDGNLVDADGNGSVSKDEFSLSISGLLTGTQISAPYTINVGDVFTNRKGLEVTIKEDSYYRIFFKGWDGASAWYTDARIGNIASKLIQFSPAVGIPTIPDVVFEGEDDNTIEIDGGESVTLKAYAVDTDYIVGENGVTNGQYPDHVVFTVENDASGIVEGVNKDGGPWAVAAYDNALYTGFYVINTKGLAVGTYTFDVVATDEKGSKDSETITVNVNEVAGNNAPTLNDPLFVDKPNDKAEYTDFEIAVGESLSLTALAWDEDAVLDYDENNGYAWLGNLTFSVENDIAGLVKSVATEGGPWAVNDPVYGSTLYTGLYTIEASGVDAGVYMFDVVFIDDKGAKVTQTVEVTVTGGVAGNTAPILETPVFPGVAQSVVDGVGVDGNTIYVKAGTKIEELKAWAWDTDEVAEALAWSSNVDATTGLVITSVVDGTGQPWAIGDPVYGNALYTGLYTIDASAAQPGTYTFDLIVTDEQGVFDREIMTVVVTGAPVIGDLPEIHVAPHAVESYVGVPAKYTVAVFEWQIDDDITVTLEGAPAGVTVEDSGELTDLGEEIWYINVAADAAVVDAGQFNISVSDGVNDPVIHSVELDIREYSGVVLASREDVAVTLNAPAGSFAAFYTVGDGYIHGTPEESFSGFIGHAAETNLVGANVIPFQIPSSGSVESASFNITAFRKVANATTIPDASLYGVDGFRSTPEVLESDVENMTLLVEEFIADEVYGNGLEEAYSSNDASIAAFINQQIAAGAKPGDYVFFSVVSGPNMVAEPAAWLFIKYYTADGLVATDGGHIADGRVEVADNLKPYLITEFTLGLDDLATINFDVYPNPVVNGEFTVRLPEASKNVLVEVIDINGRMISSSIENGKEFKSNVNLSTGVYIVKISNSEFRAQRKLIVR
ncbi:MAG: T9SS type A sorting domain-containing protein [Bacteroidota bacterium]